MRRTSTRALVATCSLLFVLATCGSAQGATNNIYTVANGLAGTTNTGDGGDAFSAGLAAPDALATTADGGYLVSTTARIRFVSASGTITTVAGTGTAGYSGDGGLATSANIGSAITGLAVLPDGSFIFADLNNTRVRRVAGGVVTTVAGNGLAGSSGDGGPATSARFTFLGDLASTGDGGFLVSDSGTDTVRRVQPDGTITRVAGTTGTGAFGGDGGPATSATLNTPLGLAYLSGGSFLVADYANHRVRRVDAAGTITTVAGGGGSTTTGNGGPAVAAGLESPSSIALTADGGFVFSSGNVVRRVDPSGRITGIAGQSGTGAGSTGDNGPATSALMNLPTGLAPTADGGVLVADRGNNRVRFVDTDLRPGPSGPAGPQGTAGVAGAAGTPGAPGPAGATGALGATRTVFRLAVALTDSAFSQRRGKRLTLRYAATSASKVTADLTLRGKRVLRVTGSSKLGTNTLAFTLKQAGSYKLVITAVGSDGQKAMASAAVKIRA